MYVWPQLSTPGYDEIKNPRTAAESQWSCGLRRASAAEILLGLRVRIPPGTWVSVSCECFALSGRSLCYEPIIRPEELYRMWCVLVCDIETLWMRRPWHTGGGGGCCALGMHWMGWCYVWANGRGRKNIRTEAQTLFMKDKDRALVFLQVRYKLSTNLVFCVCLTSVQLGSGATAVKATEDGVRILKGNAVKSATRVPTFRKNHVPPVIG